MAALEDGHKFSVRNVLHPKQTMGIVAHWVHLKPAEKAGETGVRPMYHNDQNKLNHNDLQKLAESWITAELAQQAGLFRVNTLEGAELVGRNGSGNYAGIVFPNVWPGETRAREYRLRRDSPEIEYKDGQAKEKAKYLAPPGRGNLLYFVPGTQRQTLTDSTITFVITEGEKKALALFRLATETSQHWLVIGLSGVWNWKGTTGKTEGPNGERRNVKGPISDLDRIAWHGHKVFIVFDSNVHYNSSVSTARRELAQELVSRNAKVFYVNIPVSAGVNGVDDLLALWGPQRVVELFEQAEPFAAMVAENAINLTDLGNARRLVRLYGRNLRYCYAWNKWLIWHGNRWQKDDTGEAMRLAKRTVASIYAEATENPDENVRKAIAEHARRSESEKRLKAMVALAESEPEIPVTPEQLDADPWLLNCKNGTLNLRTGQLREHRREDLLTKLAPVDYDPHATSSLWHEFLDWTTQGDKQLQAFLQRAVGYTLTGDTSEEVLFFIHGPKRTGKSTFIDALKAILGDYHKTADFETFLIHQNVGAPRNDIAQLVGARMVASIEVQEGRKLAEGLVKMLTGGDTILARFLYKEHFEYRPSYKLWLVANHKPRVKYDDDAFWDRIRVVPFNRTVPKEKRDPKVKAMLRNPRISGSAILAWAVQGSLAWQHNGLGTTVTIEQATEAYQQEMDPLKDFFTDCCIFHPDAWAQTSQLWDAYQDWAKRYHESWGVSRRQFGIRLAARGLTQHNRKIHGCSARGYSGIGLVGQNLGDLENNS